MLFVVGFKNNEQNNTKTMVFVRERIVPQPLLIVSISKVGHKPQSVSSVSILKLNRTSCEMHILQYVRSNKTVNILTEHVIRYCDLT